MKRTSLLAILLLAFNSPIHANGLRNPPESATALALSGGKITQIDDPSAIAVNPANLTSIKAPAALASTTLIYTEAEFTSPTGVQATTRQPVKVLPNFFAVLPIKDTPFIAGLGVTTPFGQSTAWSRTSPQRYSSAYFAQLMVLNLNPTVAMKINDDLSIGAGADFFLSRLDLRQFFPWSTLTGNATSSDGEARSEADGFGWGGNLGITWRVAKNQRLALTYRSSIDVEYDGQFHVTDLPPPTALPPPLRSLTSASGFHTGIEFPTIIALGYGIDLSDKLSLASDIEWVQFSKYHTLRIDLENNNLIAPTTSVLQDWHDIFTIGMSADYKLCPNTRLMGSYHFLPSPIPDRTYSPTLPDSDKHVVSIGLIHQKGRGTLAATFAETFADDRDITNNQNPAFNGHYEVSSHILAISCSYSF